MWLPKVPEIIVDMLAKMFLLLLIFIEIYFLNQKQQKMENDEEKEETSKQRRVETKKTKQTETEKCL